VFVPAAAVAAALSATCCCCPGTRLNVAGEAVTPVGKPLKATLTLDEKPPTLATLTITFPLLPVSRLRLVGVADIE
jgi:hypothetical protein